MTLLLDPRLLAPPGRPGAPLSDAPAFWQRLIDWDADPRAKLGIESRRLVCDTYAQHGYPDRDISLKVPTLRREYQAALGRLLSRVHDSSSEVGSRNFVPAYLGSAEESIALQMDVAGTRAATVLGIATDRGHWDDPSATQVKIEPPSPPSLSLCVTAGERLVEECEAALKAFYRGKRIHIVGARPVANIEATIRGRLGLGPSDLNWIECEKARPPRDLAARWRALLPGRDITVCITGRVGHATSEMAAKAARRQGVIHLLVQTPQQVVAVLASNAAGIP